ncbi:ATP-binding protein [Paraburkholderia strydomiana]
MQESPALIDDDENTASPPSRDFRTTRRVLIATLIASVLLPVICLGLYSYFDYQRRQADALDTIDRLTRVAEENAVKVLDLNREMTSRIAEMLGDLDEGATRQRQEDLYRRLCAMAGRLPQVAAISVFSADGDLVANSRYYPVPEISIYQRADFQAARDHRPATYFSLPLHGAVAQTDVFNTVASRMSDSGEFLGVISVALRRSYFEDFYRQLAGNDPHLTIGLYRSDANILVRYPRAQDNVVIPKNTPFAAAFRQDLPEGHVHMRSSVDGRNKTIAFRRLTDYPLYVSAGFDVSQVFAEWWKHDLLVALLTLVPCLGVWLLIGFSLYRLRLEQTAWESWQKEAALRANAEATSRQLRRMGALGNLVANVAHDFNNLLMVVASNMELARRKGYTAVQQEVHAVERAATTASVLSRKLLSVARKKPMLKEHVQLFTWLPDTMTLLQTAVGSGVACSVVMAPDLWDIAVDKAELESALINIAANSKDAMPKGGTFAIRCENVSIDDESIGIGDFVVVTCADNGTGMQAVVARRAFETLFTTKQQGAGTGLGLAQVLAMCEQAGGTARIRTEPGKGTEVSLYLPRSEAVHAAETPLAGALLPDAVKSSARSVLLIEDNEDVAAGLSAVFLVLGWNVRHELTGDDALAVLETGKTFDLIVSDIQMPGKHNGLDIAEHVKARWPEQRFVLMTGYADEMERGKRLGYPILSKPFSVRELEALTDACSKS